MSYNGDATITPGGTANCDSKHHYGYRRGSHALFCERVAVVYYSGGSFSATVTALDASNNTVTGYSGTVHFSSTDLQATLPVRLDIDQRDRHLQRDIAKRRLANALGNRLYNAVNQWVGRHSGFGGPGFSLRGERSIQCNRRHGVWLYD